MTITNISSLNELSSLSEETAAICISDRASPVLNGESLPQGLVHLTLSKCTNLRSLTGTFPKSLKTITCINPRQNLTALEGTVFPRIAVICVHRKSLPNFHVPSRIPLFCQQLIRSNSVDKIYIGDWQFYNADKDQEMSVSPNI